MYSPEETAARQSAALEAYKGFVNKSQAVQQMQNEIKNQWSDALDQEVAAERRRQAESNPIASLGESILGATQGGVWKGATTVSKYVDPSQISTAMLGATTGLSQIANSIMNYATKKGLQQQYSEEIKKDMDEAYLRALGLNVGYRPGQGPWVQPNATITVSNDDGTTYSEQLGGGQSMNEIIANNINS